MPTTQLPASMQATIDSLARRQLIAPALLLIAGHRPLAFIAGQTLHLAAPMAAILGFDGWSDWAQVLSDPQGADQLLEALDHAQ
jgi:hypothetical protein